MISHAMEDYLKTIYLLGRNGEKVSTSALAKKLNCSAASVTNMLQKLASLKLVQYKPYQGVRLTTTGNRVALEVLRHHRLIELYLKEVLGYSWDKVHAEAEQLEHVISEEFEDRIASKLGDPQLDPHGEPIPTKDGAIANPGGARLSDLEVGQSGVIIRVLDDDPALLRYLAQLGMQPETHLMVTDRAPFGGPLYVRAGSGEEQALGSQATNSIYLQLDKP